MAIGHDGIQQVLLSHKLLYGWPGHVQLPLLLLVPDGLQDHLGVLGMRVHTGTGWLLDSFGRHLGFYESCVEVAWRQCRAAGRCGITELSLDLVLEIQLLSFTVTCGWIYFDCVQLLNSIQFCSISRVVL